MAKSFERGKTTQKGVGEKMARVYSTKKLDRFDIIESKELNMYLRWTVTRDNKIIHWFEIGNIRVGFTVVELERMFKEAAFMEKIISKTYEEGKKCATTR